MKNKKRDLRDGVPHASITNTNSRMAGGADNPNVAAQDDTPLVRPGPTDRVPEGQDTKSS